MVEVRVLPVDLGVQRPGDLVSGLVPVDGGAPVYPGLVELRLPLECQVGPEMEELGPVIAVGASRGRHVPGRLGGLGVVGGPAGCSDRHVLLLWK